MTTQNTKYIHDYMANHLGWCKSNRRFALYGSQRAYSRIKVRVKIKDGE